MTKRERFEIMKAYYEEGKTIESRFLKDGPNGRWYYHDSEPDWNWDYSEYRVQQEETEQKIRPYANAEEFLQAQNEHGMYLKCNEDGLYYIPYCIANTSAFIINQKIEHRCIMYKYCVYDYVWQDGTPCGIIE